MMLLLAARLLIAASFLLAALQDVKERAVYDWAFIPGAVGAGIAVYASYVALAAPYFYMDLLKLLFFGGAGLAFVLMGRMGEADVIAITIIAADPSLISFLSLVFTGVALGVGVAILYMKHLIPGSTTVTYEQFVKESRWIPIAVINDGIRVDLPSDVNVSREKATELGKPGSMVLVQYGLPVLLYFAVGYFAYLLLAFALGVL